jgi:cytochrome c biogenesis protein CcmG/thiol:disulfide interchange protein DsbE
VARGFGLGKRDHYVGGLGSVRSRARAVAAPVSALAAVLVLSACGSDTKSAVKKGEFKAALADAPAPLAKLYSKPNAILDGGPPAYRRQLEALEGFPVVVNKWASWCGPCRFEFPFFQRQTKQRGASVAFFAVNSEDNKKDARKFLKELPVPYPSYFDPSSSIARLFKGDRVFPATAFYDREGNLVHTRQGAYASEAALARDVARYAR